jgi:hypothetical protein
MRPHYSLIENISKKIEQAKQASYRFLLLHGVLVTATVIAGSATTFVTAKDILSPGWVAPLLAVVTTGLGTIANQTDFRKKSIGYRLTKTEFQNLKLECLKDSPGYSKDELIDEISRLRCQKIARTTNS